jgi:phosphatidate cytidylyltransferase
VITPHGEREEYIAKFLERPYVLRWRLISASIVISLLVAIVWIDFQAPLGCPGIVLGPLLVVLAALGCQETLSLLAHAGHKPLAWTAYAGTIATAAAACVPAYWPLSGEEYPPDCPLGKLGWPLSALALGVCLAFVGEMRRYEKPGGAMVDVALAILPMTYVGLLIGFFAALRLFHDNGWGMTAVLSLVIVVKVGDSGAYFTGRAIGRHKMSPRISPGKTIEGGAGAILASALAGAAVFLWLAPWLTGQPAGGDAWQRGAIYGVIVGIVGMVGDLAESLFKRDVGRKDSSTWLPGLGGILDMLDSLLFAAPVAWLCFAVGLVGPSK